jgi:hypothetical protein
MLFINVGCFYDKYMWTIDLINPKKDKTIKIRLVILISMPILKTEILLK